MKTRVFDLLFMFLLVTGCILVSFLFESDDLRLPASDTKSKWIRTQVSSQAIKTGDLIFRHGRGFISNALMSLAQHEKKYSHAGIVSVEEGKTFVYHAIGGEENITNKLRKDLLADFCSPSIVHSFGIFRTDLEGGNIANIITLVKKYYGDGLEFDTKFDLYSDDKMYCTELIYKVFKEVLGKGNYLSLSAFSGKEYISCDDLYLNIHSKPIFHYQY